MFFSKWSKSGRSGHVRGVDVSGGIVARLTQEPVESRRPFSILSCDAAILCNCRLCSTSPAFFGPAEGTIFFESLNEFSSHHARAPARETISPKTISRKKIVARFASAGLARSVTNVLFVRYGLFFFFSGVRGAFQGARCNRSVASRSRLVPLVVCV